MFVEATIIDTKIVTVRKNTVREKTVLFATLSCGRFGEERLIVTLSGSDELLLDTDAKGRKDFLKVTGIKSFENHSDSIGLVVTAELRYNYNLHQESKRWVSPVLVKSISEAPTTGEIVE